MAGESQRCRAWQVDPRRQREVHASLERQTGRNGCRANGRVCPVVPWREQSRHGPAGSTSATAYAASGRSCSPASGTDNGEENGPEGAAAPGRDKRGGRGEASRSERVLSPVLL